MSVIIDIFSIFDLRRRSLRLAVLSLFGLLISTQMFCVWARGQAHAQGKRIQLDDPMFGISYNASKVHYELMPMPIRQICPGYERGTYWVFAHLHKEFGDYYVVMGTVPGQDGDSLGAALLVKDSKCYVEDSTQMLSGFIPDNGYGPEQISGTLPGLNAPQVCNQGPFGDCHYVLRSAEEESVLRGLVSDALTRGGAHGVAWLNSKQHPVIHQS